MRHRRRVSYFGRRNGPRKALMRGLVDAIVANGRIKTTLPKAKEARRYVERAVTLGRKGGLHARRTLLAKYPNQETVQTLMDDLANRFKDRPGGYTRIIKLGSRPGDNAEMAFLEFVDFELPEVGEEKAAPTIDMGAQLKKATKRRKRTRKLQQSDRRISRAKNA